MFAKYSLQTLACHSHRACSPVAQPTFMSRSGRVIVTSEQEVREDCRQWWLLMVVFYNYHFPMRLCGFSFIFGKLEKIVKELRV